MIEGKEKRNVLALIGDLGSGKTTFTQGFCKELGIEGRVVSPTFILVRKYSVPGRELKFETLYHADLYRLEGNLEKEIENIGLTDFWKDKDSVVLIEWSEKIEKVLPESTLFVKFEYISEKSRKIVIE